MNASTTKATTIDTSTTKTRTAKARASAATTEQDPRWAAVRARDAAADGTVFYSVETTGVYCRPSCGARRANAENVRFHATAAAAEAAGFRPCLRCRPQEPPSGEREAQLVARACRAIERADAPPLLATLAASAGVSRWHFHRLFKAETGVTPRAYATAHRARRMRDALTACASVTDAIYESGFGSSGRFYETSARRLGMTPTSFRAGGADTEIRFAVAPCDLGSVLVAFTARGVCAILLGDGGDALIDELRARFPRADVVAGGPDLDADVARVVAFVGEPGRGLGLPLDVRGTAFQQRVWQALAQIPAGTTATYSDVARRIGAPRGARAVAGACATNPLAVAIPCHRVVGADGRLTGYRWGLSRKQALLTREVSKLLK